METMSYFVGESIILEELFEKVNIDKSDRLELFGSDKIFIPGFVDFQYGELSENCKPHIKYIGLLKKFKLYERVCKGYVKGIHTLEEQATEEEKEKDKIGGMGEREIGTMIFDIEKYLKEHQTDFEIICMAAHKSEREVLPILKKYHLWNQENDKYPKKPLQLIAGLKKMVVKRKRISKWKQSAIS